ncbi:MAG: DUF5916 domain-containing protein, partial [Marinoscillum sp.]
NLWAYGMGTTISGQSVSNADLRGGPSIRYPGQQEYWAYIGSNYQKKLTFELNPWMLHGGHDFYTGFGVSLWMRYQPTDALNISVAPSVNSNKNALQYVDSYQSGGFNEYVLGNIDQVTYSASLRVNYIVTPNLSIEYWGQPFMSRGEYDDFKRVVSPNASEYGQRYVSYSSAQISHSSESNSYLIDHDFDGQTDYELNDPNFNFMQFRSNFVVRWEYVPGSTLFLVWTSSASEFHNSRDNHFRDLTTDLRQAEGTNIFLIKYTYRFIL